MLKRNSIEYKELTSQDIEISSFPTIQEELQLLPSNVKHSKFLVMEPDDLKVAIMQLKTKNGHIIRKYYVDLEKLLKLYVEYTLYFNHIGRAKPVLFVWSEGPNKESHKER